MVIVKFMAALLFFSVVSFHSQSMAEVKSFKEWKESHVQATSLRVKALKSQLGARKVTREISGQDPNLLKSGKVEAVASLDLNMDKLESELANEIYNLEVANDLSVTDYFVGYLAKVPNRERAFDEVAGKLTPQEVSELMKAYVNTISGRPDSKELNSPRSYKSGN